MPPFSIVLPSRLSIDLMKLVNTKGFSGFEYAFFIDRVSCVFVHCPVLRSQEVFRIMPEVKKERREENIELYKRKTNTNCWMIGGVNTDFDRRHCDDCERQRLLLVIIYYSVIVAGSTCINQIYSYMSIQCINRQLTVLATKLIILCL